MNGRRLILGLLIFTAIFAVVLWYFQTRAHYREVTGVNRITVSGRTVPVSDYRGLDGSSPLKLRGCMRLDPAALADLPQAEALPLIAPRWFDCYDAGTLTADIAAGRARAVMVAPDEPEHFEIVLAYYPDGRAYLWRQLNARFRN